MHCVDILGVVGMAYLNVDGADAQKQSEFRIDCADFTKTGLCQRNVENILTFLSRTDRDLPGIFLTSSNTQRTV